MFPVWLDNLIAYSPQIAVVASAGTLLVHLFRLRAPWVTHTYWKVPLVACLLIPAFQSWKRPIYSSGQTAVAVMEPAAFSVPVAVQPEPLFRIPPETPGMVLAAGRFPLTGSPILVQEETADSEAGIPRVEPGNSSSANDGAGRYVTGNGCENWRRHPISRNDTRFRRSNILSTSTKSAR